MEMTDALDDLENIQAGNQQGDQDQEGGDEASPEKWFFSLTSFFFYLVF